MAVALTSPKRVIPTCSLCSRLLSRCNERRVLHSSATSGVWSALKEASAKLYSVKTIGTFWCSLSSEYPSVLAASANAFGVHSHSTNFRPHGFSHALFQLPRDTLTILQFHWTATNSSRRNENLSYLTERYISPPFFRLSPRARNIRLARETTLRTGSNPFPLFNP